MCLDFWVWSSTSRSGSHVLDVDASDVRLSFFFCGPFHVVEVACVLEKITSVDVSELLLTLRSAQLESEETGRD